MLWTVIVRILAPFLGYRITFDIRSLAFRALDELHLVRATAYIVDVLGPTHFLPSQISHVRLGLDIEVTGFLTVSDSRIARTRFPKSTNAYAKSKWRLRRRETWAADGLALKD